MATSDSRFKSFKLNSRSKPPPLPPKDSLYPERYNPSLSSIDIQPKSPISPPMNPSTSPTDRRKDKALGFLKFTKRGLRSPSGTGNGEGSNEDLENPPPPEPDSQISTPWNFQHNIHVDEGYIGLPPSWSTSLATAGFSPEEIAEIQARRVAGSLAPDFRYLFTERPSSPLVQSFPPATVPLISNPTSRSASLPLNELPRQPLPSLTTSTSLPHRQKRKPPLSVEQYSQNGHKPNQSYSSTTQQSSDSHQSNTSASSSQNGQSAAFSVPNNSTPYHCLNPSTSTSNLSSCKGHSTADDDGQTPLAMVPPRLGPSDSNDALSRSTSAAQMNASPSTRFVRPGGLMESGVARKLEIGETEGRSRTDDRAVIPRHVWGNKRTAIPLIGKLPNPSLSSLASSSKLPPPSSTIPLYLQQQQMTQSAPTTSAFAVAASSSLSTLKTAAASTSLSIAAAVRNTKGAIRRGLGTSKDDDGSEEVENPEDEEFVSDVLEIDATSGADDDGLSVPAGQGGRKAVWQLYTRPRTSTDASSRSSDANQKDVNHQPSANTTEEGRKPYQSYLPFSRSPGSIRSLMRQKVNIKESESQVSLSTQGSVSEVSLNSVSAVVASGSSTAAGLGTGDLKTGDVKLIKKHQNSESVTSLASIPEDEASTGLSWHPYAMASNAASSVAASKKPSVTPAVLPNPPNITPPHKTKASLDLSTWSEALLSGISTSAELDLAFTFNEVEKKDGKKGKGKDDDGWNRECVTENGIGVKKTERGESEIEPGSPLTTARPFGYPTQTSRNVSAAIAGTSHGQQSIPPKPRYPPPARPIPPIITNNNDSSSTSIPLIEKPPPHPTGRSCSNSNPKPSSPTVSTVPLPLPFSPPPNGLIAHHHVYGQSPKPPPAVPLPPPPLFATSNVPTSNSNNNNTTLRGILSPAAASMLSPPPSAYPNSFKSPTSSTGPDSAQLWNEIETMMNPGLMQSMGSTGAAVAGEVVLGLPPVGIKGSVKTAGGAGGGPLSQSQAEPSKIASAGTELDADTSIITAIVGDLDMTSPSPSAALTESSSPILPSSPKEERRMAITRALRAGDGVLGTRTQEKKEEESDGVDSGHADLRNNKKESEGHGGNDYSDQEHPVVHISNTPDRHIIRDNFSREVLSVGDQANRDSSRSSSSTLTAEAVAVAAATTIVKKVSIARRAGAVVLKGGAKVNPMLLAPPSNYSGIRSINSPSPPSATPAESKQHSPSSLSCNFGNSSEESAGSLSLSISPSSPSQDSYPTPATDSGGLTSPLMYYLDGTHTPSPLKMAFGALPPLPPETATTPQPSRMKAQNGGGVNVYDYNNWPGGDNEEDGVPFAYPDEATVEAVRASMAAAEATAPAPRPTIVISDELHSAAIPTTAGTSTSTASLSPFQLYRGWLSTLVAPLEEFIDESVDPRNHYLDLTEIAEGDSGSVFSARLSPQTASQLRLPPAIKAKDAEEIAQHPEHVKLVAIKSVAIVPSGSPKLVDLQRELKLMKGLEGHENVLGMDGVYVDLVEDSLWLRMELMERSLADMVGLVGNGLMLQDRMFARFAGDVLSALEYLQKHSIAHRDVRSDNLLLNKHGVLKLADFSNSVQVTKSSPMRSDPAGVVYWQAPEVRKPPYNVLKVDVWSLGATVWEMAQTEPPFSNTQQFGDRWPPLRQPELYSPAFHDFLRKCSEPAPSRPNPSDLLKHPFVHNACGRPVIVHLLSQCMAIEQSLQQGVDSSP